MPKIKQKFILFGLLILALVGAIFNFANNSSLIAHAIPYGKEIGEAVTSTLANSIGTIFGNIFQTLYNLIIRPIISPFIEILLNFGINNQDFLLNGFGGTYDLWRFLLSIANGIYLLALFIASIAIILRINVGVYNIKKVLGGFITAVILSNLSLYIIRAIFSFGTMLTNVVFNIATSLKLHSLAADKYQAKDLLDFLTGMTQQPYAANTEALINFLIIILTTWFLLKIGLVLLERSLRLFILAITAPVIFAISLLPNFQKITSKWWEDVIKWILILPVVVGILIMALYMFYQAGVYTPDNAQNLGGTVDGIFRKIEITTPSPGRINPEDIKNTIFIALGMFSLWAAGMMNKYFNLGAVAAGFVETPQKALQTGQGLYKKGADFITGKSAGPTKVIQDTLAGKNLGGQIGQSLKRQSMAGSLGETPKNIAVAAEAKRQRMTAGIPGMIFNPKGRGAKMEADIKRNVNEAMLGRDVAQHTQIVGKLNTAAQASKGKGWFNLNPDEQKELAKDNPTINKLLPRYKELYGTMAWRGRKSFEEERMEDWDKPELLAQAVTEGALKNSSVDNKGKGMQGILKLARLANSRGVPEETRRKANAELQALIKDSNVAQSYGDVNKFIKTSADGGGTFNSNDFIRAIANLSATIKSLETAGVKLDTDKSQNFAKTTENINAHDIVLALRKLSDKGINSSSDQDDINQAIDDLKTNDPSLTKEFISDLKKLTIKGLTGKLAQDIGSNTKDATSITNITSLINKLKTDAASVSIQQSTNIDSGIVNEFESAITKYQTDQGIGIDDIDQITNEWIYKINEKGSAPSIQTVSDAGIDDTTRDDIFNAFQDNLVKLRVGGATATADNITMGEVRDVLGNAAKTIHHMKEANP